MAKTYLVPVDFSQGSDRALDYAIKLAREDRAKLVVMHAIVMYASFPVAAGSVDLFGTLEDNARNSMRALMRRKRLKSPQCRPLLVRALNAGDAIAETAKKTRAAMIVMGSHGRTGLRRLMLGSVAERTLRIALCPVLVFKK